MISFIFICQKDKNNLTSCITYIKCMIIGVIIGVSAFYEEFV